MFAERFLIIFAAPILAGKLDSRIWIKLGPKLFLLLILDLKLNLTTAILRALAPVWPPLIAVLLNNNVS